MHVQTPIGVLTYDMPISEARELSSALLTMAARVEEAQHAQEMAVPEVLVTLPGVRGEKR